MTGFELIQQNGGFQTMKYIDRLAVTESKKEQNKYIKNKLGG